MTRHRLTWLVGALCGLTVACSGGTYDPGASTPAEPLTPEQMPAAFASAYCDSLGRCCADAALDFDTSACRTKLDAQVRDELLPSSPPLGFDFVPEAAATCIENWSQLCSGSGPSYSDTKDSCSHLYRGHAAKGQECELDDECVAGLACLLDTASRRQVCLERDPGLPLGASCENDTATCAEGSYCAETGSCRALTPRGSTCLANYECTTGFCDTVCTSPAPSAALCRTYVPGN